MPPGNGGDEVGIGQASPVQHRLHQPLIADSQRLVPVGLLCPEIHKAIPQPTVQLGQKRFPARAGQVHLVHEHKGGDAVPPQQPPERLGMALHAVGAADNQHRIIQHLQ